MNDKDLEIYAYENDVPIMMKDGIEFLCEYISNNNIKNILECGTAIGYSSIKMASLKDDIYIDTLEIKDDMYNKAIENIKEANLESRITCHLSDAAVFETDKKYDLIFIDAAKAQYKKYMDHFMDNLNENGVFFFDNLNFHGMVDNPELTNNRNTKALVRKIKAFRDYISDNKDLDTQLFTDIGDGLAVVKILKR